MLLHQRYKLDNKPHIKINQTQNNFINNFSRILNEKKFKLEILECLICNANDFEILSEKDRYGFFYPTGICRKCGHVQQTQYLSNELLNIFYKEYYNGIYFDFLNPEIRFKSQYKLAYDKYNFILNYLNYINNKNKFEILEVGCGPGGILKLFQEKGFSVTGIDLDEKHLNYGRQKNLNLINKKNFTPQKKFDLVIISHVLEHMKNPKNELEIIKNYSHNDTLIYIEVPSIYMVDNMYDSDFLKYLHIAHCYHFSSNSFKNFCNLNYLKILKINKKIQCICKFSNNKEKINYDYINTKKKLIKLEVKFSKFGRVLIFKRVLRRLLGKILNLLGVKKYILKLINYK